MFFSFQKLKEMNYALNAPCVNYFGRFRIWSTISAFHFFQNMNEFALFTCYSIDSWSISGKPNFPHLSTKIIIRKTFDLFRSEIRKFEFPAEFFGQLIIKYWRFRALQRFTRSMITFKVNFLIILRRVSERVFSNRVNSRFFSWNKRKKIWKRRICRSYSIILYDNA